MNIAKELPQGASLICFTEAARLVPPLNGRTIHRNSVWRWAAYGKRGHKLKVFPSGGQWGTTKEWLEEFLESTRPGLAGTAPKIPPKSRKPRSRPGAASKKRPKGAARKSRAKAKKALSRAGI